MVRRKGTGTEGESLATIFAGAEDTLTATVFERLVYLPDVQLIKLLFAERIWGNLVCKEPLPQRLDRCEWWPRLEAATGNSQQKEPDVVLHFNDRVLIVEAKRHDLCDQQNPEQLAHEWAAARLAYPDRSIWLLAVGGLRDNRPTTRKALHNKILSEISKISPIDDENELIFGTSPWSNLLSDTLLLKLSGTHWERIQEDLRQGALLHGIGVSPPGWLADLIKSDWQRQIAPISDMAISFFVLRTRDEVPTVKFTTPVEAGCINTPPASLYPFRGPTHV